MGEPTTRVRLVRTLNGQRLDIPPGFMLGEDEAILRSEGGRLILEPVAAPSLLSILDSLEDLDEAWPEIEDAPPGEVHL